MISASLQIGIFFHNDSKFCGWFRNIVKWDYNTDYRWCLSLIVDIVNILNPWWLQLIMVTIYGNNNFCNYIIIFYLFYCDNFTKGLYYVLLALINDAFN